jgi:hypothetical protein
MAKQESLIRAAVATLGVGASIAVYRSLKNPDNPLRGRVLEIAAEIADFNKVRDSQEAINSFCYPLPGPRIASSLTADILVQPNTVWHESDIRRVSLSPEVNGYDPESGFTSYIQVKPADQDHFPKLYILKEYGWPYYYIKVPFANGIAVATLRSFLVGKNHVPEPLLPPSDISNQP